MPYPGRPGRPRGLVDDARRILGHLPEQELDAKATEAVASLMLLAEQEAELAEDSGGGNCVAVLVLRRLPTSGARREPGGTWAYT